MLAELKRIEEDERRILVVSDSIVCIAPKLHVDCNMGRNASIAICSHIHVCGVYP